jgi:hypothetical protein
MTTEQNQIAKDLLVAAYDKEWRLAQLYWDLCKRAISHNLWQELWAEYKAHSSSHCHLFHAWLNHTRLDWKMTKA